MEGQWPDEPIPYRKAIALGKRGRPRKGEEKGGNAHLKSNGSIERTLARLDRDGHAELAARVRAGEMSAYVSRHPPKGLGASVDLVRRLLVEHPDALEKFERALKGEEAQALDAETPDLKDQGRPEKGSDIEKVATFSGKRDSSYALARLRRDRPDLHSRVVAGELTPHAAMVLAGFRKPKLSRKLGPLDRIRAILPKLSTEEIRILRKELDRCDT